jgi:hypothetical protein
MEYYYLFVFTVTQSVVTGLKSTLRKENKRPPVSAGSLPLKISLRGTGKKKPSAVQRKLQAFRNTAALWKGKHAAFHLQRPICAGRSLCLCFMALCRANHRTQASMSQTP